MNLTDTANYATILATILSVIIAVISLVGYYIKRTENKKLWRQNRELAELNPSLDVLKDYKTVWAKVQGILEYELKEGNHITIKNFGLDLELIIPDLKLLLDNVTKKRDDISIHYLGLIINPESPAIAPLINGDSNIQTEFVKASYRRISGLQQQFKAFPSVKFEAKPYDCPPTFHGILICDKHLFLGFTEIKNQKIFGSDRPYIYMKFNNGIEATKHYFTFYKSWFDYYWNDGK